MSVIYEKIERLCRSADINITEMCRILNISRASLSDLKMGRKKSLKAETLSKIASHFNVPIEYLLGQDEPRNDELPALTKKDERDIARRLESTLGDLEGDRGSLMFDGEPLDDETRELLRESLKNSLEWSKRMAKKKYTPKKYRKPHE